MIFWFLTLVITSEEVRTSVSIGGSVPFIMSIYLIFKLYKFILKKKQKIFQKNLENSKIMSYICSVLVK